MSCTHTLYFMSVLCDLQVLAELKEYATEVDVDFVRKAVRAIGRCAIKVEVRNAVIYAEVFSCASQSKNLNLLQTCHLGIVIVVIS